MSEAGAKFWYKSNCWNTNAHPMWCISQVTLALLNAHAFGSKKRPSCHPCRKPYLMIGEKGGIWAQGGQTEGAMRVKDPLHPQFLDRRKKTSVSLTNKKLRFASKGPLMGSESAQKALQGSDRQICPGGTSIYLCGHLTIWQLATSLSEQGTLYTHYSESICQV